MTVYLNGAARELPDDLCLGDVLVRLGVALDRRGVAVALDGDVVLRSRWMETSVRPGQRIELLEARPGG